MTKAEFKFRLTRPANKQGEDRYESGERGDPEWMIFYIPQSVSRKSGKVRKELVITVT